jgi:hypothetical protein
MEKLTSHQEARLPEFRDFGNRIGFSTERSDRAAADSAIRAHYVACGLAPPLEIRWFDSPYASTIDAVQSTVWNAVQNTVGNAVRDAVWDAVRDAVQNTVRNAVQNTVQNTVGNAMWNTVGAHYDADTASWMLAWDQFGVQLPKSALTFIAMTEHVWWMAPFRDIVFVSDRPAKLSRDDAGRQHCENGKAIEFADGWGVSAWHGQTIPDGWVTGSPPKPADALHWRNMDQRAAACEIVGWHNILDGLAATVVDDSGDPEWGRLVEVNIPDSGKERFLDAMCGTGRRFALPVPPTTMSVDDAQSALHGGLPASILRNYEKRT